MRVEAQKYENGFLIPRVGIFEKLTEDKIWLNVEIIARPHAGDDSDDEYSALDKIIGLCAIGRTDASVNHDRIIYAKDKQ